MTFVHETNNFVEFDLTRDDVFQCTAEAQEVTIARAIDLKHSASLVSSLAYETSKMYTTATDSLSSLDVKSFGRWRMYLALKAKFYLSYVSSTAYHNNHERIGCNP